MLHRRIPAEELRLNEQHAAGLLTDEQLRRGLELLEVERMKDEAALVHLTSRQA
jgi:hypothetical protein